MLKVVVNNVKQLAAGIWSFDLPPHQIRMLAKSDVAIGERSVILLDAAKFDSNSRDLVFEVDDVATLNVGSTLETLAMLTTVSESKVAASTNLNTQLSRGDREFLDLCRKELPEHMQLAAQALLAGVRARSAGELKRGLSRNFSDTPDNFWYVIVQPRVEQLSITVRGPVELFEGITHLAVKDDRGNTLFKVVGEQDVEAALDLIFRAKRKS